MKKVMVVLMVLMAALMACSFSLRGTQTATQSPPQPLLTDAAVEPAPTDPPAAAPTETAPEPVDLTSGLVVEIPLDGGAVDTQSGLSAEAFNTAPSPDRLGQPSGAMRFNGMDSVVVLADNDLLDLTGSFTISFFIQGNAQSDHEWLIMTKGRAGECQPEKTSWMIRYQESMGLRFVNYDTSVDCGKVILAGPEANLLDDRWHHVAWVYDHTLNIMRLYVDGALISEAVDTDLNIANNDLPLILGNQYQGVPQHALDASLDDVRIYHLALDAQQIRALAKSAQ
jgi:hypothetical protein